MDIENWLPDISEDQAEYLGNDQSPAEIKKKHLKNVGPIRHCKPLHAHSPGVATVARQHCRTPPAHQCPRRRQRQQRQCVTEGTAMAL